MRAGDWSLLAEGGAHVVLQPSATSPFRGRVLRLRKRPRQGQAGPERDEEVALEFARLVVERLLSPELCARLEPVAVGSDFLGELAERIEPHRSAKRRAVDEVDTTRLTAVLADDLVGSLPGRSVLSVEIKVRSRRVGMSDASAQMGLPPGHGAPLVSLAVDQGSPLPLLPARLPARDARAGCPSLLPARPVLVGSGASRARSRSVVGSVDGLAGRHQQPAHLPRRPQASSGRGARMSRRGR